MALAKTIAKYGVTFQKAYCRVVEIAGDKAAGFTYRVAAFAHKGATEPLATFPGGKIAFNPKATGDIIAQCYADLKKQDAWKGAVDC